jgi:transaldolase
VQLFIDSANLEHIREVHRWGVLAGVTTNPSLVAKEGRDFVAMVHEICELVRGPVSAEVVAQDAEGMIREGKLLAKVHECVVVKVPMSEAGLTACRALSDAGIRVNVTLCFQPSQALLAGLAGATYISPFAGRVDDVSWDGIDLVRQIVDVYNQSATIHTQVLAASLRHPLHLTQAALAGAHVATAPYTVIKAAIKHPLTDIGNKKFLEDWASVPDRDIAAQVERWLNGRGSVS